MHLETIEDSSDEDLPSLPGTGGTAIPAASSSQPKRFKDSLEELNKRRRLSDKKSRSKEKQARRVVASPSPSPEPVVVVASRPASTNASPSAHGISRKKRINVRATSSSGKPPKRSVPMFRAPSDDSDAEAVDSVSEQSDAVKGQDTSKSSKSTHKGKKRRVPSSSSSSSSSSASSAPPSEEEMSEVEEDISLDFNPLVRDKLRPKDNSKAHRLDKLKQARAAKESKCLVLCNTDASANLYKHCSESAEA